MSFESINISIKKRNYMMSVLLLGAFVSLLAETFLNNALPTIMNTFGVNQSTAQWLTTAYLLVVGLIIPLSAWIFNSFSLKTNYLMMLGIFLAGSLICLFSPNFYVLLIGRIIEAVAAGALMPFIQNVILLLFPPEKRGFAMGITGLVIGFGPAVGPTISGLILKYANWRMLFIILSVISIVTAILAFFTLKNITKPHRTTIDGLSFIESLLGFGFILYALSELGNSGHLTLSLVVIFLLGIFILFLFGKRQLQLASPLLDIRVFSNNKFNLCTFLSMLSNIAMVGIELVLPLYLQTTCSETALVSGLIMMPGAIIMGICNPISGILFDKFGIKRLSLFGFFILLLGTFPMLLFNNQTGLIIIAFCYALRMIGISFTMMTTFTAGINFIDSNYTTHANAVSSTIRQIGGSLGTALAMLVVALGSNFKSTVGANKTIALETGYHWGFILMVVIALIGIVAAFFLPTAEQENMDY